MLTSRKNVFSQAVTIPASKQRAFCVLIPFLIVLFFLFGKNEYYRNCFDSVGREEESAFPFISWLMA